MEVGGAAEATLERIARAAERAGRDPAAVRLVAVSKTVGTEVLAAAVRQGVRVLGENRAQELAHKAAALGSAGIEWHFVGHLQTNKVKLVTGVARLIHSVDRPGLAEAIARRARSLGAPQEILIQVNVAREPTKAGVEPPSALPLARKAAQMEGLIVRGLMTIAPQVEDPEEARPSFRALADLGAEVAAEIPDATELSMGMSDDLEVAVEEGATLVRVGRAIFGPRLR